MNRWLKKLRGKDRKNDEAQLRLLKTMTEMAGRGRGIGGFKGCGGSDIRGRGRGKGQGRKNTPAADKKTTFQLQRGGTLVV